MDMVMGKRGVVWKTPDITADGLKLFACVCMLIQSVGIAVVESGMIHLDQYTQESLSQAMAQDSHLMMLAGICSVRQLIGGDGNAGLDISSGGGIPEYVRFQKVFLVGAAVCGS